MLAYLNKNVNPKNRKTGDCSTRALVGLLDIPYDKALELQFKAALDTYYDITSHQIMERVLKQFGYVKMKQPRYEDGCKYEVREMDKVLTPKQLKQGTIVTVAHHYVAIKDNYYQDIWDSGRKCVGNYYVKL